MRYLQRRRLALHDLLEVDQVALTRLFERQPLADRRKRALCVDELLQDALSLRAGEAAGPARLPLRPEAPLDLPVADVEAGVPRLAAVAVAADCERSGAIRAPTFGGGAIRHGPSGR